MFFFHPVVNDQNGSDKGLRVRDIKINRPFAFVPEKVSEIPFEVGDVRMYPGLFFSGR